MKTLTEKREELFEQSSTSQRRNNTEKKGVQCECGEFTPFTSWIFAHWDIVSEFTCPKCDRRYELFQGQIKLEDFEK